MVPQKLKQSNNNITKLTPLNEILGSYLVKCTYNEL